MVTITLAKEDPTGLGSWSVFLWVTRDFHLGRTPSQEGKVEGVTL